MTYFHVQWKAWLCRAALVSNGWRQSKMRAHALKQLQVCLVQPIFPNVQADKPCTGAIAERHGRVQAHRRHCFTDQPVVMLQ